MAKKLLYLEIQTTAGLWSFKVLADPKYLDEWRAAGLEMGIIENTIPEWLPVWIPARWFAFAQDLFGFRNPWSWK